MNINKIECKLINIKEDKLGCKLILNDVKDGTEYSIKVDESIKRVKSRLKEQYLGNSKQDVVYLSRAMINIDINTNTSDDIWYIDDESLNMYLFNKEDVKNII